MVSRSDPRESAGNGCPNAGRVIVVGLGPADADLVTEGTRAVLAAAEHGYLRTSHHPAAVAFAHLPTFDYLYDEAGTLSEVYPAIVDALRKAVVEYGEVVYAVPGSPLVAERTVELLREAAAATPEELRVQIEPAMSFLDLVWARLGIDPLAAGVRLVDGQQFAVESAGERGPLLVAQCDSIDVLSEIKLAIGDAIDASSQLGSGLARTNTGERGLGVTASADAVHEPIITVVQRLGLPDERIVTVAWHALDRDIEPDHLTSLWIPELMAPIGGEVQRFVELVATLRRECPWDQVQTHETLQRHLLEETYEVLDALTDLGTADPLDLDPTTGSTADAYTNLEEELGDLLFQIVFHCILATEAGEFTLADVARGVHDKLYSRHPHVFGEVPHGLAPGDTPEEVLANWEQLKKAEKQRDSVFDGIPTSLPSLLYALKIQKKAASLGEMAEDLPSPGSWDHVVTTARRAPTTESMGDLLFVAVNMARHADIDPEMSLRAAANRYRDVVRHLEH